LFLEVSDVSKISTIIIKIGKKILGFRNMQEKLEKVLAFGKRTAAYNEIIAPFT
jgi:hypothetical protein